ncbi:MAG: MMPL family transporter [Gammaproteobacteria bacterium]|nr:MMPL family transporter [Gammaproteobacteria bacterium]
MKQRLAIILVWGLFILGCAAILLQGPKIQSDLGQFLPGDASDAGAGAVTGLLLDTLRDSPASRVILLGLSGAPDQQLADSAKQLASALGATPHFQHILGTDNTMPESEQALLFRHRYLLNPAQFDELTLKQALQQRLKELALGTPLDHHQLRRDPTAVHRQTLQRFIDHTGPQRHLGVWFSADRKHALLLLHSTAPAFALDPQQAAIEAIRHAFEKTAAPGVELLISGPPLFAVESRKRIREGSQQLTLWASLGVALLILFAYRSPTATLLIALPLFSGIVAGAAAVVLLFDQLHGIALAFGITLIGLTVDYPIHLFSHGGNQRAAVRIWPTLRLGMLTSAVGFCALVFSGFQGLAQMGLFAISGIVVAAVVTRWLLPALQATEYQLHPSLTPLINLTLGISRQQNLRWLAPLLLVVSLGVVTLQGENLWETRLNRLSPIPAAQLEQDRQLRARFNAAEPGQLLLLQSHNLERLLQQTETLSAQLEQAQVGGLLDNFDSPSRYLPSHQRQLRHRDALPDSTSLQANLSRASEGLSFREGLFQPFIDDIAAAKSLQPLGPESLDGTLTGIRLGSLLRRHGDGWYALVTLGGIHNPTAIARIASDSGARYIDIPQQASQLVAHYRDEALHLIGIGGLLILLILAVALRGIIRLVRVALPVFTAIALTTALLTLLGESLSLFHLASLLLVMGIGLDYGLFFDHCQNAGGGCSRTLGALLICSLTTLLVFGLLALSPLPVLHAIGLTVSLGVFSTLLLTLTAGNTKTRAMM